MTEKITQSTHHIWMTEPVAFHCNPQTMETNSYQHPDPQNPADFAAVQRLAQEEFLAFRDRLVKAGVTVTTTLGAPDSPDDIFPNWASTHVLDDGTRGVIYYPMLNENRRIERRPHMKEMLERTYKVLHDMSPYEAHNIALEGTSALWMDRVNKIAYSTLSARANPELAKKWCDAMGYEYVAFETVNHVGKPVYHTDVMMFVGTGYVGICMECILPQYRDAVRDKILSTGKEIIEINAEQLLAFCGNALEVVDKDGNKKLVMSGSAFRAYSKTQKEKFLCHVNDIIWSDLPTIQKYGGGAARCMMMEMF